MVLEIVIQKEDTQLTRIRALLLTRSEFLQEKPEATVSPAISLDLV